MLGNDMMTLVKWLTERQVECGLNDARFARLIGISHPMWYRLTIGEREPGLRVLQGALRAFPERRDDILRFAVEFPQGNESRPQVQEMAS